MFDRFTQSLVAVDELCRYWGISPSGSPGHVVGMFHSMISHPSGFNRVGAVVSSSMSGEPNPDCGGYTLSGWRAAGLDETYLESWIQTLGGMDRESID